MKKRRADMFGIRLKATSVVLLGTVLALVLAASAGTVQMLRVVAGAEQRAVHDIAQGVGTASELALAVHDTQELNRVASAFLRNDQVLFVALYDQSEKLIASSVRDKTAWDRFNANSNDHGNFMVERQAVSVESQNNDLDPVSGEGGENAGATGSARKPGAGLLKQVGSVVVGLSTAPGQLAVRHQVATILISSMVAMLCAAITTFFFVGKWTVRLDRLMAASERISKGDLEVAIVDDRLDEIGRLSQAYDRMRQAVRQRDIELRQFNTTALRLILNGPLP
jgi:HAMP domain-containing protein